MKLLTKTMLAAVLAARLVGQFVALDETGKTSRLEFIAVDAYGDAIEGATIEIVGDGYRGRFVMKGNNHQIELPYGDFRVRWTYPGFTTLHQELKVDEPSEVIVLPFTVADLAPSALPTWTSGRLEHYDRWKECGYLKFVPLYLNEPHRIVGLTDNGSFTVRDLKGGAYIVHLFGLTSSCFVSSLHIRPGLAEREGLIIRPD